MCELDAAGLLSDRECFCGKILEALVAAGISVEPSNLRKRGIELLDGHLVVKSSGDLMCVLDACMAVLTSIVKGEAEADLSDSPGSMSGWVKKNIKSSLVTLAVFGQMDVDQSKKFKQACGFLQDTSKLGAKHRPFARYDKKKQLSVLLSDMHFFLSAFVRGRMPKNANFEAV